MVERIEKGKLFPRLWSLHQYLPIIKCNNRSTITIVKYLVKETNANCGYTQSDEITLMW
jgi:hypothetical protein